MDESSKFFSLAAFHPSLDESQQSIVYGDKTPKPNLSMKIAFQNFLKNQKSSKFIYQDIVSKNCERPISCQEKWYKDINLPPKEIINWKVAYQTSFQCTKSSKLITFNFKLLHRRLPTNCFLKKVGLRDDDKCSFCDKETENLIHLFWRCEKTKKFGIVFLSGCSLANFLKVHIITYT